MTYGGKPLDADLTWYYHKSPSATQKHKHEFDRRKVLSDKTWVAAVNYVMGVFVSKVGMAAMVCGNVEDIQIVEMVFSDCPYNENRLSPPSQLCYVCLSAPCCTSSYSLEMLSDGKRRWVCSDIKM